MQSIKTMFRSPRFVVGFIMVFIIVCYAIFVPIIFTADPKESRAESPFYSEVEALVTALRNEDDEAVESEIARLTEMADAENEPMLADAKQNVYDTIAAVREQLEADPTESAISALEQVKSNRKYPLVNGEREAMKALLESGDIEGAIEEGNAVVTHCDEAIALADSLTDIATAEALPDDAFEGTDVELADIAAAIEAGDEEAFTKAVEAFKSQHTTLKQYVEEAIARLDVSKYENAAAVAETKIQKTYLIPKNTPPNSRFWLGTDNFSRDLFLEMAYGARTSLLVGLLAGIIATLIGIGLGLTAGYVGGMVDNIITFINNTFTVIPSTVVLILISIALGQIREAWVTGLIIGLTAWPWTSRSVRSQTLSLRNRDHVNMAKITGYSTAHIIVTEILPYLMSYIVMAFILQIAGGIGAEATLALLGLGDPTGISLGRLMNWAQQYEAINFSRWWLFVPVAGAIGMITYGLYLMNSGMDQVFNPKIRS